MDQPLAIFGSTGYCDKFLCASTAMSKRKRKGGFLHEKGSRKRLGHKLSKWDGLYDLCLLHVTVSISIPVLLIHLAVDGGADFCGFTMLYHNAKRVPGLC